MRITTRRDFFKASAAASVAVLGARAAETPHTPKIAGFDETDAGKVNKAAWEPVSSRKIKVGIVGYGVNYLGLGRVGERDRRYGSQHQTKQQGKQFLHHNLKSLLFVFAQALQHSPSVCRANIWLLTMRHA